jgi:hypothetical protein
VQVAFQPGAYVARSYTILTADGGLTGSFAAATALPAYFTTTLRYPGNNVVLDLGLAKAPGFTPDQR